MKLYVKLFCLNKFQKLYDSNKYLQEVLKPTASNVYFIETDVHSEIIRLLKCNNVKFEISDK